MSIFNIPKGTEHSSNYISLYSTPIAEVPDYAVLGIFIDTVYSRFVGAMANLKIRIVTNDKELTQLQIAYREVEIKQIEDNPFYSLCTVVVISVIMLIVKILDIQQ